MERQPTSDTQLEPGSTLPKTIDLSSGFVKLLKPFFLFFKDHMGAVSQSESSWP